MKGNTNVSTLEVHPILDTSVTPSQTKDNFSYQKMSLIHPDHPHKGVDYPIHMALSCKYFPKDYFSENLMSISHERVL